MTCFVFVLGRMRWLCEQGSRGDGGPHLGGGEPGEVADATGLRILRNGRNLDDYVEEVPPLLGTMLAFKVTPDCWHGFKPFSGPRHSLQLNYLSGIKTKHKHEAARRFGASRTPVRLPTLTKREREICEIIKISD